MSPDRTTSRRGFERRRERILRGNDRRRTPFAVRGQRESLRCRASNERRHDGAGRCGPCARGKRRIRSQSFSVTYTNDVALVQTDDLVLRVGGSRFEQQPHVGVEDRRRRRIKPSDNMAKGTRRNMGRLTRRGGARVRSSQAYPAFDRQSASRSLGVRSEADRNVFRVGTDEHRPVAQLSGEGRLALFPAESGCFRGCAGREREIA